jgi:glycine hydroxymethyltransferase
MWDIEDKINFSVFPGHQGGPHNHTISALAVALKFAAEPEFKEYQTQVLKNCKVMETTFKKMGYELVSGGTDTHLLLLDLRSHGIDGARVERVLELVNIASNKNTVPGDKSAVIPSGLRMGSPAMTSRGLKEADFEKVCGFVGRAVWIAKGIDGEVEGRKLKDFKGYVGSDGGEAGREGVVALKRDVVEFSRGFGTVGFKVEEMKYQ